MQIFDPSSVGVSQTTIDRQTTFKKMVSNIKNDPIQETTSPVTANSTASSQADVQKIKTLEIKVQEQSDTISDQDKVILELRAKVEALELKVSPKAQADLLAWPKDSFTSPNPEATYNFDHSANVPDYQQDSVNVEEQVEETNQQFDETNEPVNETNEEQEDASQKNPYGN